MSVTLFRAVEQREDAARENEFRQAAGPVSEGRVLMKFSTTPTTPPTTTTAVTAGLIRQPAQGPLASAVAALNPAKTTPLLGVAPGSPAGGPAVDLITQVLRGRPQLGNLILPPAVPGSVPQLPSTNDTTSASAPTGPAPAARFVRADGNSLTNGGVNGYGAMVGVRVTDRGVSFFAGGTKDTSSYNNQGGGYTQSNDTFGVSIGLDGSVTGFRTGITQDNNGTRGTDTERGLRGPSSSTPQLPEVDAITGSGPVVDKPAPPEPTPQIELIPDSMLIETVEGVVEPQNTDVPTTSATQFGGFSDVFGEPQQVTGNWPSPEQLENPDEHSTAGGDRSSVDHETSGGSGESMIDPNATVPAFDPSQLGPVDLRGELVARTTRFRAMDNPDAMPIPSSSDVPVWTKPGSRTVRDVPADPQVAAWALGPAGVQSSGGQAVSQFGQLGNIGMFDGAPAVDSTSAGAPAGDRPGARP
jgi:hypothetical protein